ncbi:MAG TPA: DUF6114 domain-containing protein [Jiangellaceae bacterium]
MTADDEATVRPPGTGRFRAAMSKIGAVRNRFRQWRRARPFWGGLLIILSGLEIIGTTQLSLDNIQISIGLEGLQSILIPVILVTAGILIWAMPVHRVFYGVIALVVALYSLVGVNLGGFLIGMLLGIFGGSLAVAWSPRAPDGQSSPDNGTSADDESTAEPADGPWGDLRRPQGTHNDSIVPGMRHDRGASSARLAVAGAVAGALLVLAIVPAGAAGSILASQTTGDDCEADPDPTASPDPTQEPSPDPSDTPEPEPTATSDPDLIKSLLSTTTEILDPSADDCGPADDPTASPTADPTSEPTATPTPHPDDESGAGDETSGTTEQEQAGETDELGLPEGFELPEDAVLTEQQTLEGENLPVVAASPGRLTGSSITLYGLVYEGNVDLPTADGPLTVMKFTMDKSATKDFSLAVDAMNETLVTTTDELTIRGDVTFYTDRFVGWMLGFKWTFLPETPPPFTLPLMVFSDPEIRLVAVDADVLETEPVMNQRQVG